MHPCEHFPNEPTQRFNKELAMFVSKRNNQCRIQTLCESIKSPSRRPAKLQIAASKLSTQRLVAVNCSGGRLADDLGSH